MTILVSETAIDAEPSTTRDDPVLQRLEHAGRTLLAMRETGYSPNMKLKRYDIVRSVWEAYTSGAPTVRAPIPTAADLRQMDEALDWILFIPDTLMTVRKVVTARIWVHPLNYRYLYGWRVIARELRTDHNQVQRWHKKGLDKIKSELIKKGLYRIDQTNL